MYRNGNPKMIIQDLFRFIVKSNKNDLRAMNPNFIALRIGISHYQMLNLAVHGVLSGLFEMQWDINCPRCGGGKGIWHCI